MKPKHPDQYLKSAAAPFSTLATEQLPLEFAMNALRLRQGFDLADFTARTGLPGSVIKPTLDRCLKLDLLQRNDDRYSCSEKGWNFLDSVLEHFVSA